MKRLVHLWLTDGTIACRGLTIADIARPYPESPVITVYEAEVTCPLCKGAVRRPAKVSA